MAQSVALDQWRGVALLLVLVSHGLYFTDRVHGAGRVGVNLFFFISGLLVYRSLQRRSGLAFLWRRLKRLYPALAAYVVLMLPIGLLAGERYVESMPAALLYAMDYQTAEAPGSLGHLWSIACELQFYALAPLLFLLGGRFQVAALLGLVTAGAVGPFVEDAHGAKYHFELAVWPMMLGFCCERWKATLQLPERFVCGCLILFAGGMALMAFGIETKALVIGCGTFVLVPCLAAYLSGRELGGLPGGALLWLGQRTYSIYLWQQPLTICGYLPVALHPAGALASTLVGGLSFRWFERPFLSGSRRRETRKTEAAAAIAVATLLLAVPAAASTPSGLIVFSRTVGDRSEVFSIRPDGSGLRRLAVGEDEPALSPDGRLIATAGAGGIVVRTRAGRLVRRIRVRARLQLTELSWSPGGRWIAFLSERCEDPSGRDPGPLCADLWIVRLDGRARRRLVEANVHTVNLGLSYTWSPSGRSIVFERFERPALAIVDAQTGATRTLPGTRRFGSEPEWTRTGWIIFARQRGAFRGSDLYAVRPSGRRLHRICRAEIAERPVASRDGRQIAFLDYRPNPDGNFWHVRVVRANGRCSARVGTATTEWTLAWSPDGTQLLWQNDVERLVVGRADGRGRPRALTRGGLAEWR